MRHKGLILIVLIIAGLSLTELQAQSMVVKENAGIQTAYSLSNISKLSFSSGKLTISRVDSSSVEYALSSLQYLSFSDSTSVNIEQENISDHLIRIYPNPVHNELKIDLSAATCPNGTLNILSLEGKLLITQQITGSDIISVDMSHLPRGTYICHFSNEEEIKSIKIIKH